VLERAKLEFDHGAETVRETQAGIGRKPGASWSVLFMGSGLGRLSRLCIKSGLKVGSDVPEAGADGADVRVEDDAEPLTAERGRSQLVVGEATHRLLDRD